MDHFLAFFGHFLRAKKDLQKVSAKPLDFGPKTFLRPLGLPTGVKVNTQDRGVFVGLALRDCIPSGLVLTPGNKHREPWLRLLHAPTDLSQVLQTRTCSGIAISAPPPCCPQSQAKSLLSFKKLLLVKKSRIDFLRKRLIFQKIFKTHKKMKKSFFAKKVFSHKKFFCVCIKNFTKKSL